MNISDDDKKKIEGAVRDFVLDFDAGRFDDGDLEDVVRNLLTAEHLQMKSIVSDRDRTIEEKDKERCDAVNAYLDQRALNKDLGATIAAIRERVAKLEDALAGAPDKLRTLVTWFDVDDLAKGGNRGATVQDDLRKFADAIDSLLNQKQ